MDANGNWVSPEIAFQRTEKMNADLIRDSNMRIKTGDMAICVGDFSCRGGEKGVKGTHEKPADILAKLSGDWIIVGGNHDDNNGVKAACDFMSCEMGGCRVGVRHRPLFDYKAYRRWANLPRAERPANPAWERMSDYHVNREATWTEFCQRSFDFIICGHVHNAWKVKRIAELWHVNVGVDVNRYMPINDQEVVMIFMKAVRGK